MIKTHIIRHRHNIIRPQSTSRHPIMSGTRRSPPECITLCVQIIPADIQSGMSADCRITIRPEISSSRQSRKSVLIRPDLTLCRHRTPVIQRTLQSPTVPGHIHLSSRRLQHRHPLVIRRQMPARRTNALHTGRSIVLCRCQPVI